MIGIVLAAMLVTPQPHYAPPPPPHFPQHVVPTTSGPQRQEDEPAQTVPDVFKSPYLYQKGQGASK